MIFHHNTGGTKPRRSWTHPPRLFARHTEMSRPWGSSYNLGVGVFRFWARKSINSPNNTDGKMKNAGGNNGMLIHSQLKNGMAMRYESMLIGFPLSQCVAWICWTDTSQISNTDQLHRNKWNCGDGISAALFVPSFFHVEFQFGMKGRNALESFGTIQRRLAWHAACISQDSHGLLPALATWLKKSTAAAVAAAQKHMGL